MFGCCPRLHHSSALSANSCRSFLLRREDSGSRGRFIARSVLLPFCRTRHTPDMPPKIISDSTSISVASTSPLWICSFAKYGMSSSVGTTASSMLYETELSSAASVSATDGSFELVSSPWLLLGGVISSKTLSSLMPPLILPSKNSICTPTSLYQSLRASTCTCLCCFYR